jgi:TPR repeat protein
MRKLRTVIVVLLLTGHGLVWAGWDEANAALRQGDLATSTQALHALAEQGDVAAQSHLGVRYANGLGVPRDLTEAAKWFMKAAEQGDAVAQSRLGNMYASGAGDLPKDHKEAAKWFMRAAKQDQADAQSKLGVMYARGRGVPQDFVQAHKWFIIAGHTDDVLPNRMTSAQIAKAKRLAREWMAVNQ